MDCAYALGVVTMRTQQTGFECKLPSRDVGGFFLVVVVRKRKLPKLDEVHTFSVHTFA